LVQFDFASGREQTLLIESRESSFSRSYNDDDDDDGDDDDSL